LQQRLEAEIQQLFKDIRRLSRDPATPTKCTFGQLFDDEEAQQYYEALVGTLKSAKKRGFIDYKGQMLLKGMHDEVTITISEKGILQENSA